MVLRALLKVFLMVAGLLQRAGSRPGPADITMQQLASDNLFILAPNVEPLFARPRRRLTAELS
jgi:hypothetical protein